MQDSTVNEVGWPRLAGEYPEEERQRAMRLVRLLSDEELAGVAVEVAWHWPQVFAAGCELAGLEEALMDRLDEAETGWDL